MENSDKILFGDDAPQWYVALGDHWAGPMSAAEIYKRILNHQLTMAHYVWKKGQTEWKRICDTKTFQAAVPQAPAKAVQQEVKAAIKPTVRQSTGRRGPPPGPGASGAPPPPREESGEIRSWYLHYNDSQFGPFSSEEIRQSLQVGKINSRVHAWQDGMESWERLENLEAFQDRGSPPRKGSEPRRTKALRDETRFQGEQREAPRRPLVAKILISDEQTVIVGVCRDISIGGLQVLTEPVSVKVGTHLKMNISPSGHKAGKLLDPFVAEGIVVRILEDGRGFSFRFERLSARAQQAIEAYIESPI